MALNMDDGYRYALAQEGQDIGDAVVFYDIISVNEENIDLLASTSDGIYTSSNFGISWTRRFTLTSPVVKFFYSKKYDTFFAATNTGFYFARGNTADDLRDWREVAGAENTKIIREWYQSNGEFEGRKWGKATSYIGRNANTRRKTSRFRKTCTRKPNFSRRRGYRRRGYFRGKNRQSSYIRYI
jgi:hypothetical protein